MGSMDKSLGITKLLKEIMMLWKHNMGKVYESSGLTVPQGAALTILSKAGKMKIHELSEKLWMTDSTMSGIIDRLEKQGMVERTRSLEDKRVVYVSITSKFVEIHQDFHQLMDKNIEAKIGKGTPEELDAVTDGLNTLKKLMFEK